MAIQFENFYETTLGAAITATDLYIPLTNPPATATEGWLLLDWDVPAKREFIYYTSKDAGGVTVTLPNRGKDGTAATTHLKNAKVRMNVNKGMIQDILAGVNLTDGVVTPIKWTNPYKASVYLTGGGQNIPSQTWTKVEMQTEVYDTNNNYNTSLFRYVAPVTGFYDIYVQVQTTISGLSTTTNTVAAIYKNGAPLRFGDQDIGNGNSAKIPRIPVTMFAAYLVAGDYIEAYAYVGEGGRTISGGLTATCMDICLRTIT